MNAEVLPRDPFTSLSLSDGQAIYKRFYALVPRDISAIKGELIQILVNLSKPWAFHKIFLDETRISISAEVFLEISWDWSRGKW